MKNLYHGIPITQEIGKADIILVASAYTVSKRGQMDFTSPCGQEIEKQVPTLPADLAAQLDIRRRSIKNRRYGMMIQPKSDETNKGTLLGIWQAKYDTKNSADLDLVKYSLSLIQYWASDYDRVVVDLPGIEWGIDDIAIGTALNRLPDHVLFYRGHVKTQQELDREAWAQMHTGNSYGFSREQREREQSQESFHRR